jgi:Bacterial transcriptional activator domain
MSAEYPLRERPRALQMLALYRCGRQADALAAYRSARGKLVDELGLEPGSELQELERAILQHHPSLDLKPSRSKQPSLGTRTVVVGVLELEAAPSLVTLAEPGAGVMRQSGSVGRTRGRTTTASPKSPGGLFSSAEVRSGTRSSGCWSTSWSSRTRRGGARSAR